MNTGIQTSWFSNGNLIISGEYFVLAGAKALAVPLKFGQGMKIECHRNKQNIINWKASELGKPWFKAELNCETLKIKTSSDTEVAQRLQKLLKAIQILKPEIFNKDFSYNINCDIQFKMSWGWGSSSTLISNLANWAGIDPFRLHKQVSSGSGYDIAASLSPNPLIYQITNGSQLINQVKFNPSFKEYIYFIYLGRKQNSERSIEDNIASVKKNVKLIHEISGITEKITREENVNEFIRSIIEHEELLSTVLNMTRIKKKYFSDFRGEIKSLGAWGGDFAMVVSPLEQVYVKQYFKEKRLETLFSFEEIVKTGNIHIK
jgi:mevalonate kinase